MQHNTLSPTNPQNTPSIPQKQPTPPPIPQATPAGYHRTPIGTLPLPRTSFFAPTDIIFPLLSALFALLFTTAEYSISDASTLWYENPLIRDPKLTLFYNRYLPLLIVSALSLLLIFFFRKRLIFSARTVALHNFFISIATTALLFIILEVNHNPKFYNPISTSITAFAFSIIINLALFATIKLLHFAPNPKLSPPLTLPDLKALHPYIFLADFTLLAQILLIFFATSSLLSQFLAIHTSAINLTFPATLLATLPTFIFYKNYLRPKIQALYKLTPITTSLKISLISSFTLSLPLGISASSNQLFNIASPLILIVAYFALLFCIISLYKFFTFTTPHLSSPPSSTPALVISSDTTTPPLSTSSATPTTTSPAIPPASTDTISQNLLVPAGYRRTPIGILPLPRTSFFAPADLVFPLLPLSALFIFYIILEAVAKNSCSDSGCTHSAISLFFAPLAIIAASFLAFFLRRKIFSATRTLNRLSLILSTTITTLFMICFFALSASLSPRNAALSGVLLTIFSIILNLIIFAAVKLLHFTPAPHLPTTLTKSDTEHLSKLILFADILLIPQISIPPLALPLAAGGIFILVFAPLLVLAFPLLLLPPLIFYHKFLRPKVLFLYKSLPPGTTIPLGALPVLAISIPLGIFFYLIASDIFIEPISALFVFFFSILAILKYVIFSARPIPLAKSTIETTTDAPTPIITSTANTTPPPSLPTPEGYHHTPIGILPLPRTSSFSLTDLTFPLLASAISILFTQSSKFTFYLSCDSSSCRKIPLLEKFTPLIITLIILFLLFILRKKIPPLTRHISPISFLLSVTLFILIPLLTLLTTSTTSSLLISTSLPYLITLSLFINALLASILKLFHFTPPTTFPDSLNPADITALKSLASAAYIVKFSLFIIVAYVLFISIPLVNLLFAPIIPLTCIAFLIFYNIHLYPKIKFILALKNSLHSHFTP